MQLLIRLFLMATLFTIASGSAWATSDEQTQCDVGQKKVCFADQDCYCATQSVVMTDTPMTQPNPCVDADDNGECD